MSDQLASANRELDTLKAKKPGKPVNKQQKGVNFAPDDKSNTETVKKVELKSLKSMAIDSQTPNGSTKNVLET